MTHGRGCARRASARGCTHSRAETGSHGSTCRAGARSVADAQAGKSIPNGSNDPPESTADLLKCRTESQFALFKTELIRKRHPWRSVEQVELATLEWVWWFNNQRLHSEIGNVPPVEIEQAYYAEKDPVLATASHGNT